MLSIAIAKANQGHCDDARNILIRIQNPSDDVLKALGWAYLCLGGATADRIATSIYNYTSDANNLTILGALARELLPTDQGKRQYLTEAVLAFTRMTTNDRNIQLGIGYLVRAASILSAQSENQPSTANVERDDVTASTCDTHAPTCTTAIAADCPSAGRMSDSDVTAFSNDINSALGFFQTAGVANLSTLATRIISGLGADSNIGRCFIRSSVIPQ